MYFASYKRKSPCLSCDKRKIGCHSNCLFYQKYKEKIKIKEEKEKDYYNKIFICDSIILSQHKSYR